MWRVVVRIRLMFLWSGVAGMLSMLLVVGTETKHSSNCVSQNTFQTCTLACNWPVLSRVVDAIPSSLMVFFLCCGVCDWLYSVDIARPWYGQDDKCATFRRHSEKVVQLPH